MSREICTKGRCAVAALVKLRIRVGFDDRCDEDAQITTWADPNGIWGKGEPPPPIRDGARMAGGGESDRSGGRFPRACMSHPTAPLLKRIDRITTPYFRYFTGAGQ